jgi:putative nucleotidyltransferase with HDIG domain
MIESSVMVVGERATQLMSKGQRFRTTNEALRAFDDGDWSCVIVDGGGETASLLRVALERKPRITRVVVGSASPQTRPHLVLGHGVAADVAAQRVLETHALLDGLHAPVVSRVLENLQRLPAMPRTYAALLSVVDQPKTTLADIAEIVARDPPLAAKVLQIVNSALFGSTRQITSLSHAVQMLGADAILGLTLSAHMFSSMEANAPGNFSLELFQQYSVHVARLAKQFAAVPHNGDGFTAGLVHDIGKLILALRFPEECATVEADALEQGITAHQVEQRAFGTTHAEVGARLLLDWGVPFAVVQAVALHHRPSGRDSMGAPAAVAVHAAQALLGIVSCGDPESELDVDYVTRAGCAERLPRWRELAEATATRAN